MREIKFRAWNEVLEKMFSWSEFLNTNMKQTFIAPESTAMILMQYTGLKDKNGKEIYEGDIVKIDKDVAEMFQVNLKGVIKYIGGSFIVYDKSTYSLLSTMYNLTDCNYCLRGEVIGNIYDNPELLEEEKNVKNKG